MTKLKKTFINANLIMIGVFALMILILSAGQDNGIMIFILTMCIGYSIFWTVVYILVFGTIKDLIKLYLD